MALSFYEFLIEKQLLIASSNLKSLRYNEKTEELIVWFRSGGVYSYEGVPLRLVKRLTRAASRGKFFHKYIRFSFPYKEIKRARRGYTNAFNVHHKSVAHGVHADEHLDEDLMAAPRKPNLVPLSTQKVVALLRKAGEASKKEIRYQTVVQNGITMNQHGKDQRDGFMVMQLSRFTVGIVSPSDAQRKNYEEICRKAGLTVMSAPSPDRFIVCQEIPQQAPIHEQIVKTFQQYITEEVTKNELERLRADAGAWTKNARRIKNGADLAQVASAYKVWQRFASKAVYERLLGTHENNGKNETYAGKELREKWWTLVQIYEPFTLDDDRDGHYYRERLRNGSGSYVPYNTKPDVWDALYARFETRRDSIYTKLARVIRDAFKALDYYMTTVKETPDHAAAKTIVVDGFPVHVITNETNDPKQNYDPADAIRKLRSVLAQIKKAGLGRFLNKLQFHLYTSMSFSHDWTAAEYTFEGVKIYAAGNNPHTIAHEIGHHAFYQLGPMRKVWEDFIDKHRIHFTDEDFDHIHAAYLKAFAENAPRYDKAGHNTIHDMFESLLVHYIGDPVARAKFKHYMIEFGVKDRRRVVMSPFTDGRDLEKKWQEFRHEAEGRFLMFAPSEYSNKNSNEAFCEVWGSYIVKDHPLADLVRATFEEVVGLR